MSLRENLEGFLAHTEHVRNLLARGEDGYQQEFTALKTQSQRYKTEKTYATKAGEQETNIRKNRYKDILPFDYTRIKLPEIEGIVGSDYINASFVKGFSGNHTYVASQGPLPQTVTDFWRMIWEINASIIVMSCNEYEMGKHKCERYWVDEGEVKDFNDIKVSMISQRRVQPDYLIRTLKVKRGSEEERVINQFHYTAWPDHGVPNSVLPIIEMVELIRDYQSHDDVPLLVHCSAGCGRTGTICVIDYVYNQLKHEQIGADFNLYELVQEMRRQRPAMVQTRDQYELVHRAVAAMFNKQLEEKYDDYSRVYENVHLKPPQVDKPRMPPTAGKTAAAKMAHSPNQQRKRHSDHNYVNAMPGQVEGEMVRVPTLPGSKGNRPHSIDNASLDIPIYANMRDEIEKDTAEADVEPQSGFTRKCRESRRKTKEIFSELEDMLNSDSTEVATRPPTSPKPTVTAKPSFSKPMISAKPSNAAGARPPTAVKPHVNNTERPLIKPNLTNNLERPVPMQRKNKLKLHDGKSTDGRVSPQRITPKNDNSMFSSGPNKPNLNPFVTSTSTDIRRKSGPFVEVSQGQGQTFTKDPAIRSVSVGVTDSPENKLSSPQIISQLNQVLAGGNKKPSDVRTRTSMKRPGFTPPKPPEEGRPKPPPASAKPGRHSHSHEYEPVTVQPPPPKKDSDKDDLDKGEHRLQVQVTPIQRTNLRRFSDDENAKDQPVVYSQSMRRKQEELDSRAPKTLPRPLQPSQSIEYAYAQGPQPGRVEQMLKEKEAKKALNTGLARTYASAYSEVDLNSPDDNDDNETKFKLGKDGPAKPVRSKLPSASSAYEQVELGAPVGDDGEDVFRGGGMDEGTYGQYNDVGYVEDNSGSNKYLEVYATTDDVEQVEDKSEENVGVYGMYEGVQYQDDQSDSNVEVYGMYQDDQSESNAGVYGAYNDVQYQEDESKVGVYGEYKDVGYLDGKPSNRIKNADIATHNPAESRDGSSNVGFSSSAGLPFPSHGIDVEDGPPALPERTQESYELVDLDHMGTAKDQEQSSAGTNRLKFKEFYNRKKDALHKKKEEIKIKTALGTSGLLNKIVDGVKRPADSSSVAQSSGGSSVQNPPSGPPPRPPPQINQQDIIEKTLKTLEKQPDQPFMYNNHDISYPNRVPKPKPPRQPPQAWADRSAAGQVSYVPL